MADIDRNHFKKLRYKDDEALNPMMTIKELSEKLGISTGVICKLEKQGAASANAETIKIYHDKLKVSYDYLYGETDTRDERYAELGKIFPFDDTFYQNLEELLEKDGKCGHMVEYMLSAIMYRPDALYDMLFRLLASLHEIYLIQNDDIEHYEDGQPGENKTRLSKNDKRLLVEQEEEQIKRLFIGYLREALIPLLDTPLLLKAFESRNDYLENDAKATQEILDSLSDDVIADINNLPHSYTSKSEPTITVLND